MEAKQSGDYIFDDSERCSSKLVPVSLLALLCCPGLGLGLIASVHLVCIVVPTHWGRTREI